jgi:hypothetical protein
MLPMSTLQRLVPWCALLLGGCSAVLGLDGLAFDRTAAGGGAGGSGAAAGSGGEAGNGAAQGGGGAGQGGGGAHGGTGGAGGDMLPLVTEGSILDNTVSASVAGRFKLVWTDSGIWQLESWIDLGSDPLHDLGPDTAAPPHTDLLFIPAEFTIGANWYDLEGATIVDASLYEQAEGRMVLHSDLSMPGVPSLDITTMYTAYASGRVGVQVVLHNGSASPIVFDDFQHGFTTVNANDAWTVTPIGGNVALTFERTDAPSGTPALVVINQGGLGTVGSDATGNRYFQEGSLTIPASGEIERDAELQVWPSGSQAELQARIDDARNPELVNVSGGNDAGYRYWDAAYEIDATSNLVTFAPSAARTRFYPAFYLANWSSPTWSVWLGAERLCSSADRIGPRATAVDFNQYALLIVFLDVIPTSATLVERTFTVRDTL